MATPFDRAAPDPAFPEEHVLALDNIPLELPLAGVGSRALAAFLDYLLLTVFAVGWLIGGIFLARFLGLAWGWGVALVLLGWFVLEQGYFAGVEVATGGRSFGKWALDLKVVTRAGGQPAASALLVRNLVRTADLIAGVPLMLADPLARRLGDRLAGTLVLHVQRQEKEKEGALARIPRGWAAREVALLESFLRRAPELESSRAGRMAARLLEVIAHDDPELLEGVDRSEPLHALRHAVRPG